MGDSEEIGEEAVEELQQLENEGQLTVAVEQTGEVIDIENQFSTFKIYYGEPDTLLCKACNKIHKLCQ